MAREGRRSPGSVLLNSDVISTDGKTMTDPGRTVLALRWATWAVLVLMVCGAVGGYIAGREFVGSDEQEHLDNDATALIQTLKGLGSQYGSSLIGAAAVAQTTNGSGFADFVASTKQDPNLSALEWSLYRVSGQDVQVEQQLGSPPRLQQYLTPKVHELIVHATQTRNYVVLGLFGTSGLDRRIAIAAASPTFGSSYLAYAEIPLVNAVAPEPTTSTQDTEPSPPPRTTPTTRAADASDNNGVPADIALALYLGPRPDPKTLILAFGADTPFTGRISRVIVHVGAQKILLVVKPTGALSTGVTRSLPWLLAGGILGFGLLAAVFIETWLRRRAARRRLDVELRRGQQLEAVGRLAGGIAHDFNNLLSAILSYADLAMDQTVDEPVHADLEEIRGAARRGADLVRQLLVFSRREKAESEPIDVNGEVQDLERLLSKMIGDDVELLVQLTPERPVVEANRGQLEQVLMNLVVNARDAIEGTGTISVETGVVELDRTNARRHAGASPGRYARLTVSDTGEGMPPEVLAHAFEPFFTTKGPGQGTGLGLATVYGTAQRAGGYVTIDSVRGERTTVSVFLPLLRVEQAGDDRDEEPRGRQLVGQVTP